MMKLRIILIINITVALAMAGLAPARGDAAEPEAAVTASPAALASPVATASPAASPVATASPAPEAVPSPAETVGTGRRAADVSSTVIGGYGEANFESVNGPAAGNKVDLERFVVFVGHRFDERLAFYSELEVEHTSVEVEVEQAYLDYLVHPAVNGRAGVILVPVGLVNLYHEPPTFHGVERTEVDTTLIPTTWREPGVGLYGEPLSGIHYQLFLVDGLNAAGFAGSTGVREGRLEAVNAPMNSFALVARVEASPLLGLDLGASFYGGGASQDQAAVAHTAVRMGEADLRFNRGGLWLRAEYVVGKIQNARAVDAVATTDPIGSGFEGGYGEIAIDPLLLALRGGAPETRVWPFVRYERTNTQEGMPVGFAPQLGLERSTVTAGVTVRVNPRVAVKSDYQWIDARGGNPPNLWHAGLSWMF